jgi:hypothetical protein
VTNGPVDAHHAAPTTRTHRCANDPVCGERVNGIPRDFAYLPDSVDTARCTVDDVSHRVHSLKLVQAFDRPDVVSKSLPPQNNWRILEFPYP